MCRYVTHSQIKENYIDEWLKKAAVIKTESQHQPQSVFLENLDELKKMFQQRESKSILSNKESKNFNCKTITTRENVLKGKKLPELPTQKDTLLKALGDLNQSLQNLEIILKT